LIYKQFKLLSVKQKSRRSPVVFALLTVDDISV